MCDTARKGVVENVVENVVETLTETDKSIIELIRQNSKISASIMASVLKMDSRTVQRHLKSLKERRIIDTLGGDKGGHWEIIQ